MDTKSKTAVAGGRSKSQIDRIGGRLRQGLIDADAIHALESYRAEFSDLYRSVEYILRDKLGYSVTGRPAKSTIAIIDKLQRQRTRLTQIQDIAGCRVIVDNVQAQDSLVAAAAVMFSRISIDDKREVPTNGYRAVHLIVSEGGKCVEIQVRTRLQHFWAEMSEKAADTYGQEIKYGKGDERALDLLGRISKRVQRIETLFLRRLAFEKKLLQGVDKKTLSDFRKTMKALDLLVRQEFYELRRLTQEIGA